MLADGALPDDEDLSAKFWIGYETLTGSNYMIVYAEITDDVFEFTPDPGPGGGGAGWKHDSWEFGIGAYQPASVITGSDHSGFEVGEEPDYQWRGGLYVDGVGYMHGYDDNKGELNGDIPTSATIGDTTNAGMYRLLSIISTNDLSGINSTNSDFVFPTGENITTIPLGIGVNDADGNNRESQVNWARGAGFGGWWNTPSSWDVVALVGRDAIFTSNDNLKDDKPIRFSLEQNYPNPFNPSTKIEFTLPVASDVTLEVFNMLGQKVATLMQNKKYSSGPQEVVFDASGLASGIYVYRISTADFVQSKKMTLIK